MARYLAILFILTVSTDILHASDYYGKKIGSFSNLYHQVSGDVYVVDSNSLHIRNFKYDGDGPDAYFWAGSTAEPSKDGFIVPDEKGTNDVLQPYRNKHITLTLPDKKSLKDIKWLSVWCRKFTVDFGNVKIPDELNAPQALNLGPIKGIEHGLTTGPVTIVDAQTFMIPDLNLDGLAPDAHFWAGKGDKPDPNGTLVPDENGSDQPLGFFNKKTMVIRLPDNLTVFDIDYFGVWCRAATSDFGHFKMPQDLNVPPSPKMLGQSVKQKLNCEVLNFEPPLEVRWVLTGQKVIIQLVTRIPAGEYIGFGLSGHQHQSIMVGGDVVVAWIDRKGMGHAVDYYLDAKAQCAGGRGSCPDDKIKSNSSHVTLLNSVLDEGFTMITYTRPLDSGDSLDKPIKRDYPQPVIWAVGPLNSLNEVSYHNVRNFGSQFLVFGRAPAWNCPSFDPENRFTPPSQAVHYPTTTFFTPTPTLSPTGSSISRLPLLKSSNSEQPEPQQEIRTTLKSQQPEPQQEIRTTLKSEHRTKTEQPEHRTRTEQPEHRTRTEQPQHRTRTEQPQHRTRIEQPEHRTKTEQPEHRTKTEQPEHRTKTEQPEQRIRTTVQPEDRSTASPQRTRTTSNSEHRRKTAPQRIRTTAEPEDEPQTLPQRIRTTTEPEDEPQTLPQRTRTTAQPEDRTKATSRRTKTTSQSQHRIRTTSEQPEAQPDTQLDAQPDAQPDQQFDAQLNTQHDSQLDTQLNTQHDSQPDTQPNAQWDVESNAQPEASYLEPWYIPPIQCNEPADGVFYAQIGPTGGKRGYSAITGSVGWGIAWYINGLLIPEITVVRGKTYRFVVEGGNDTDTPARNHPFYITDDLEGGYAYKSSGEKMKVRVYAGVQEGPDGSYPTGLGRLCQWTPVDFQPADRFASFGEYQRYLTLRCAEGHSGVLSWTPDANTPDTVYYQCYTHRYLGWKIHVVDECDLEAESSIISEHKVLPPLSFNAKGFPKVKQAFSKGRLNALSHPSPAYKPVFKQLSANHGQDNKTSDFFLVRLQTGFRPIPSRSAVTTATQTPKTESTINVSVDPFKPNTSIPFHSGFRPGIPDYGGFVSTNRENSDAIVIQLPKRIVSRPSPQKFSVGLFEKMHPSEDSNDGQSTLSDSGEILQAASSEQSMVIYRTFGGRNIPPLPSHLHLGAANRRNPIPPQIKIASLQPVSFDGSPVPDAQFSQIQPLPTAESRHKNVFNIQNTRQYGPFKGQKPPAVPDNVPPLPQFNSRNPVKSRAQPVMTKAVSETDYNILNNVWNIISSQGGKGQ